MNLEKPSYSDPNVAECYVDDENEIHVILPSDIWINADQAEAFGQALLRCAEWVRKR